MGLRSLVSSLKYLESNGRQVLLGGIRLGGSATYTLPTLSSMMIQAIWHYNAQIGYAGMHVLYILPLLPTYRATVLRFLAHRSLPIASRYYRTMLGVSVPTENLIKPT